MEMDNLAYKEPPRVERIEGKTYLMSPRPRVNHNQVSFRIAYIFARYLEGKTCVPFADGTDVHLDAENTYIPDAMIVCDPSIIHEDGIYGAPDLVVEVLSPSTMQNDRGPNTGLFRRSVVRSKSIIMKMAFSSSMLLIRIIPIGIWNAWMTRNARPFARRFLFRFMMISS